MFQNTTLGTCIFQTICHFTLHSVILILHVFVVFIALHYFITLIKSIFKYKEKLKIYKFQLFAFVLNIICINLVCLICSILCYEQTKIYEVISTGLREKCS